MSRFCSYDKPPTVTQPQARQRFCGMTDRSGNGHRVNPNAALQGASRAYVRNTPASNSKPPSNTLGGGDGALSAARGAGRILRVNSDVAMQASGNSGAVSSPDASASCTSQSPRHTEQSRERSELVSLRQRLNQLHRTTSGSLQPPAVPDSQLRSPSRIAATLAASRSMNSSPANLSKSHSSPSILATNNKHPVDSERPLTSRNSFMMDRDVQKDVLDTSHIPPTNALIGVFEQAGQQAAPKKKAKPMPAPVSVAKAPPPPILSPRPIRGQPLSIRPLGPSQVSQSLPSSEPISIPPPKKRAKPERLASDEVVSGNTVISASREVSYSEGNVMQPPARRSRPATSHAEGRTQASARAAATIDAMANAIVASSLASSRAGSPAKHDTAILSSDYPPVPPPRRGGTNHSLFHIHHHSPVSSHTKRTPSPQKILRQTMRKPPKSDEDDDPNMERATKRRFPKKHPNKHHEGDRKRWRDKVTERERKRYEAVWASNKGLFALPDVNFSPPPKGPIVPQYSGASAASRTQPDMSNVVVNIVVRDIWSRSRLGDDILEEVWDLVDRSGKGYLCKEEFVVGLWLIDQRLKGRKLPSRVGDSVWATVGLGGIKVKHAHKYKGKSH